MHNPFQFIRENVNIIEAAQMYGIEINRNKKALCIFHEDNHPSMSFKNNMFKCFSCGASGSIIDLAMKLFELTAIEAAKKIFQDMVCRHLRKSRLFDEYERNTGI